MCVRLGTNTGVQEVCSSRCDSRILQQVCQLGEGSGCQRALKIVRKERTRKLDDGKKE